MSRKKRFILYYTHWTSSSVGATSVIFGTIFLRFSVVRRIVIRRRVAEKAEMIERKAQTKSCNEGIENEKIWKKISMEARKKATRSRRNKENAFLFWKGFGRHFHVFPHSMQMWSFSSSNCSENPNLVRYTILEEWHSGHLRLKERFRISWWLSLTILYIEYHYRKKGG